MTSGPLPPGTRLAHYEVGEPLGAGGMGTVYLARDTALDRPVALKVLRPEVGNDPALVDRFVREARAAARVNHANLTHVYFVGDADGRPYFAMEYCPGATLEATVRERGPRGLAGGIDVLVQAARGLAAAHGAGVVHRDVKPSNLMVLPDGTVKVTDFGLAKSLSGDVQATAGRVMGTPTYMSPEQVRGKPVDARTDVYLLGLTGHFLFTGKPPYASDQIGEVINDQMNTPLPSVSAERPDLPPALDAVLGRMCAKDPARRPATMEEVARLLEALRPRPLAPAPIVARAMATGVDGLFVLMGWGGLGFLLNLGLEALHVDLIERSVGAGGEMVLSPVAVFRRVVFLLAAFFLTLFLEIRSGTTPGKTALHLRVVRRDGSPAGWRTLVLRFLVRFPAVLALFVPWGGNAALVAVSCLQGLVIAASIVLYFATSGRTLSDLVTRTKVVYRAPAGGAREP